MKYNFDQIPNRRNTNSHKWDIKEGELPMWVADMDFETCPAVKEAIINKAQIGAYGYTDIPDAYYEAYIAWWKKRHHITYQREWMNFSSGTIPAVSSIVRRLTDVGDYVICQTPVYNTFFSSILHNDRQLLENKLIFKDGEYFVDFEDLEEKMKNPKAKLMILCNPHNPLGKIWPKETLERIGKLARENNVIVLSDEVHCDVMDPGYEYTPFNAASELNKDISVTCLSCGKAFNLAGLQASCVIVPNEEIRKVVFKGLNDDEVAEPNFFAIESNIAALTKGEEWLNELNQYLANNKQYVKDFFKEHEPSLKVISGPATYLLWIDISKYTSNSKQFCENLRQNTGLFVSNGSVYLGDGDHYLRLNVATSLANVKDGLNRLLNYVHSL